jgi:hypothetical protein
MRHTDARITLELYAYGEEEAKLAAQHQLDIQVNVGDG